MALIKKFPQPPVCPSGILKPVFNRPPNVLDLSCRWRRSSGRNPPGPQLIVNPPGEGFLAGADPQYFSETIEHFGFDSMLGDVHAGATAHATSVRLTPAHVAGPAIRVEPDHVCSAAVASKQPTIQQVWRAATARGHTGAELLPRCGHRLPGLCDLGGLLLREDRRTGIRDDDPILRRTFTSRLCADIPDAVPAKLQQNAGLQQCIPCRGYPILLAPPRDSCLVCRNLVPRRAMKTPARAT